MNPDLREVLYWNKQYTLISGTEDVKYVVGLLHLANMVLQQDDLSSLTRDALRRVVRLGIKRHFEACVSTILTTGAYTSPVSSWRGLLGDETVLAEFRRHVSGENLKKLEELAVIARRRFPPKS